MSKKDPNQEPAMDIAKPYEPTPDERAAREAVLARRRKKVPRVRVTITESEGKGLVADWSLDHPNQSAAHYLLMEALGAQETNFYTGIVSHLLRASTHGQKIDEAEVNFLVSVIKGIQPKDQLETMLAAQMAAVHMLTMDFARRLNNVDNIPQQDSAERALNKLARTFAAQLEALKRYRTGGEQRVVVQHVSVNEGGQAIVGSVTHGGAGSSEKRETECIGTGTILVKLAQNVG